LQVEGGNVGPNLGSAATPPSRLFTPFSPGFVGHPSNGALHAVEDLGEVIFFAERPNLLIALYSDDRP